jgi:multidrug resistance efflux pump
MKNNLFKLMTLIVVVAVGLTACANDQPTPTQEASASESSAVSADTIIAEGNLKPIHATNLSFLARGVVEEVNVQIGDSVTKGDVLARLVNANEAEAQLAAANLELLNAQQALDTLNRTGGANGALTWEAYQQAQIVRAEAQQDWDELDPRDIEDRIDDQETEVNDRADDLKDAQEEFDKYKDLDENNSTREDAEDDLRAAQEDYNNAVAELEEIQRESDSVKASLDKALADEAEAKHQYELSLDGANTDQIAVAQSRVDNAEAQVTAAEAALGNYILTAPFAGVVADVAVSVGEQVGPDDRGVSVMDDSAWVVESTDISELEAVDIQVGQSVRLTPDALPDVTLDGIVTAVSQSSYTSSGDVLYTVYIAVQDADPRVKWGMTVEAAFEPQD